MKQEQKQQARDLYLQGLTQAQIKDILSIDRKTLYLWIRNGEWDKMKIAARQAPRMILQDIYNHIDAINQRIYSRPEEERCPTMQEVEMFRKLLAMTKTIERQHTGLYMDAFQELCMFIYKQDPALAQKITPLADRYVKGTLKNKTFDTGSTLAEVEQAIKEEKEKKELTENDLPDSLKDPILQTPPAQATPNLSSDRGNAEQATPSSPETPPSPPVVRSGQNGEFPPNPTNPPKPATDNTSGQDTHEKDDKKFPISGTEPDGENNPAPPDKPKEK